MSDLCSYFLLPAKAGVQLRPHHMFDHSWCLDIQRLGLCYFGVFSCSIILIILDTRRLHVWDVWWWVFISERREGGILNWWFLTAEKGPQGMRCWDMYGSLWRELNTVEWRILWNLIALFSVISYVVEKTLLTGYVNSVISSLFKEDTFSGDASNVS